jgi:hypothetical protein
MYTVSSLLTQTKPNALDEDQYEAQRSTDDDGDHDVIQPNVKFACLKEQGLLYGDIPDDDPIDYHDVDVGQGILEELADAIESLIKSAEQAGMFFFQSLVTMELAVTDAMWHGHAGIDKWIVLVWTESKID